MVRDPRIPRTREQLDTRVLGELPYERVLTAAASDYEDLQGIASNLIE